MDVTEKMLRKDISKVKQKLCKKACKSGLYENFGQSEVMRLQDKYYSEYSSNGIVKRLIDEFNRWCMDFDDKQLEEYRRKKC